MERFDKKCDDIDTMGNILEDAGNRMLYSPKGKSLESGSNCFMKLDLSYHPWFKEGYTPILNIDCTIHNPIKYIRGRFEPIKHGREMFEKRRKQTFDSIRKSLKKISE